ncbi:hypothetical protein [Nocardia sp. NPDC051570]|uniref:hypothetical protein n=1 Tax=Nocardia sp. NPDC051570 TaxID=3364324 RepID=UPI0037902F57
MTALVEAGGGRKVVQLFGARPRGARHAVMHRHAGRHARARAGSVRPLYLVRPDSTRHTVAPPVRVRRSHTALDRYDRFILWGAGWLLRLRIALIGENPVYWD